MHVFLYIHSYIHVFLYVHIPAHMMIYLARSFLTKNIVDNKLIDRNYIITYMYHSCINMINIFICKFIS